MYRYKQGLQIVELSQNDVLKKFAAEIDTKKIPELQDNSEVPVVVFNTLTHECSQIVQTMFMLPNDKKPVSIEVYAVEGEKLVRVPSAFIDSVNNDTGIIKDNMLDVPQVLVVTKTKIKFLASSVPGMGYKTFIVKPWFEPVPERQLNKNVNSAENEFYELNFNNDGTFNILDKKSGRQFNSLHYFEDSGDVGDGYNYVKPENDVVYETRNKFAKVTLVEKNELSTVFCTEVEFEVPGCYDFTAKQRAKDMAVTRIKTLVELQKNNPVITITTTLTNANRDRRLRVCFPTGIKTDVSYAENQFDVVKRNIIVIDTTGWQEQVRATLPMKRFMDISDGDVGFTLYNQGIPEFEVADNSDRTVKLTLLRCIGKSISWDGRSANVSYSDGQCQSDYNYKYAVQVHEGDWESAQLYKPAYEFDVPMVPVQTTVHKGRLPVTDKLVTVSPDGLIISALKKCEIRDTVCLRLFNITSTEVKGKIQTGFKIKQAYMVSMNEERLSKINVKKQDTIELVVPAKRIITIELVK
jgi:alpha-mannosidase